MEVSTVILPIAPAGDRTSGWPFNVNNLCRYAYSMDALRSVEGVMPMPPDAVGPASSRGHSVRSTRIGSTAAARRAGRKQASNAAANRIIPTAPNAE